MDQDRQTNGQDHFRGEEQIPWEAEEGSDCSRVSRPIIRKRIKFQPKRTKLFSLKRIIRLDVK